MIPQLQRDAAVAAPDRAPQWSTATKIGFRFAFSYFLLYLSPGPVGSLSSYKPTKGLDTLLREYVWHPMVSWVGGSVLHLSGRLQPLPNGSGDQLYDYVLLLCMATLAALATVIWSVMDRKRPNYQLLNGWLRLFMRLTLAWGMLGYGVKKLVGAQFTPPTLERLVQPFGQASPTGLLWTFMGASQAYSLFGGLGETIGGALVLIPRLVGLGSLISLAMMANVFMLNMCYDVPRKILSIHLILMCLYLLIPEGRRLANVFLLNRRAEPVVDTPLFGERQWQRAILIFPLLFGVYEAAVTARQSVDDFRQLTASVPGTVRGIWAVEGLTVGATTEPSPNAGALQWQSVIFDAPKVLSIQTANGAIARYYMQLDDEQKTVRLWNTGDPQWRATLHLNFAQRDQMTIAGSWGNQDLNARLTRVDLSDPERFQLLNRGFHWVNDYVNNR